MSAMLRVVVIGMALAGVARADPRIGERAPALALVGLDGKPVALATDRVAVVDFYATWCEPCQKAVAAFGAIRGVLGSRFQLLIVDVNERPEVVRAFLQEHPLPEGAVIALDADGDAARRWGQHRFPTTFLVDAAGVIRHINRGYGPGYEARLRLWLRGMLHGN